jgi:Uma2 family endonuclease
MNTVRVFPEPAWDVSRLFPAQGAWSEGEYLNLPGSRLAEFDQGHIEVLDMPSELHQLILAFLYRALSNYAHLQGLGMVLFAPFPVKLWEGKMREPDIVFMRREHADRRHDNFWDGADLVMEVTSPHDQNRDKITKRDEYARAGIPEYWLVDPLEKTVTVFALSGRGGDYATHGVFELGSLAESASLAGFAVDISALFSTDNEE